MHRQISRPRVACIQILKEASLMYLFAVLAFVLIVVFLMMLRGRQSASIPSSRKSQGRISPDTDSDLSLVSTYPPQDNSLTLFDSVHEAGYQHSTDSVVDVTVSGVDYTSGASTGGEL